MRPYVVLLENRAKRELDEVRAWLMEHRGPAHVALLDEELGRALRLVEHCPGMHAVELWSKYARKVVLKRSGYHVYYRILHRVRRIMVICVWHERRRPPRL